MLAMWMYFWTTPWPPPATITADFHHYYAKKK